MTSIAASASNHYSPSQLLQKELLSEISSGTVSSSDQSALSSALDDIDSSLTADRTTTSSYGSSAPGNLKSKIDDLISGEVSSGKLTDDQAAELQAVFKNAFAQGSGSVDGPEAQGGPEGAGGPPPGGPGGPHGAGGPPRGGHHPSKDASSTDGSSSADDTSSADSTTKLLQDFLKLVQDSKDTQSSTYEANGSTSSSTSSSVSSLLLDYSA